ncbi:MAG TPA: endonuclease/exonuclease/phosphatase family protein [Kofleriaceae bacterium]|nr:endonuclease/exonuclease/phosphatase family protein [Kofleriaceae bacterium]
MRIWQVVIGVAIVLVVRAAVVHHPHPLRLATFNIENFPKDARQVRGALDEIADADAGFVAVQEISDAAVLRAAARELLGASWDFVQAEPGARLDLGVLYDRARFTVVSRQVHDETRLGGRNKPVLDVGLRDRDGVVVRVLVVHFACCTPGRPIRARQHEALRAIVASVRREHERVVVLGDFNATEDADRADLAALARATGMVWATEALACSAFWSRADDCPRSRLDHVLTWRAPDHVAARGACATEGCGATRSCPLYAREVSDHCPVVVTVDR